MTVTIDYLTQENREQLAGLAQALGHDFADPALLQRALIHSSFAFEQGAAGQDNETLEFLGDAVLDLVVGTLLYQRYPGMREGELTRLRAALVNESGLAKIARQLDLGRYLLFGKGEETTGGRDKASILAGSYEALLGAVFLDAGYEVAAKLAAGHFTPIIKGRKETLLTVDAKSRLQEKMQELFNEAPVYQVEKEEGPAHDRQFTVAVRFRGQDLGCGQARSKKEAEQQAATAALLDLDALLKKL